MEVLTGALPSVITKLGDLLIGEYNLQKRVKGEIRFLQAELESMKGALEKLSNAPADQLDIQEKIWARDLRELSYDIEDSIDTFMVRGNGDESTKLHGIRKFIDRSVSLLRKGKIHHGIATEIRNIKSRVIEVHERHRRYEVNLDVRKPITASVDPRIFTRYTNMKELVGIVEKRDEVIKLMKEENGVSIQQGKIVSIVGFGGLGKTTLADAVYEKIRAQFDCCAFVSVSQSPNLQTIFKGLLKDLIRNNIDIDEQTLDETRLINELREFLKTKRYLVVIDDIWDISVWKMIKCALPDNDVPYIIITTTRNYDVAEKVGGAYKLKPLSQNNSRKLLYSRIFGNEKNDNNEDTKKCPDKELAEISNRILKKCAGVPLAIITMASLLACKPRSKMDWYEVYNSIGIGLENNRDVENMRKILSFSYYNMPSQLRTCLLYLSVFPEDYAIEKNRLIWMWNAEGFIQCENQGKSLFDLGEVYFNELINRSMIQPVYNSDDMICGCCVHDMVLDLICSLSCEGNFVTILNGMERRSPSNMIRRLSLQNGMEDHLITLATRSMQQVRSVVFFTSAISLIPVLRSFQVLRVLDLQGCDLSQSGGLKYVGNLFHLRYLGLQNARIAHIPKEIGNLQFLQLLDARSSVVSCLPSSIIQLKYLMCLYTNCSTRVPNGIGRLTNLEELSVLYIDGSNEDIIEELGQLMELRVLQIFLFNGWNDKLPQGLQKLQNIQELHIMTSGQCRNIGGLDDWVAPRHLRTLETRSYSCFSVLPSWMHPSHVPDLSSLSIAVRELRQADLNILGRLPVLRSLKLKVDHKSLRILEGFVVAAGSFQWLVYCELWGFVTPVAFQQGAMPRLRSFTFGFLVKVAREISSRCGGGLELGLGNLACLQMVTVYLDSEAASDEEVKELKAVLGHATKNHPNHPRHYILD